MFNSVINIIPSAKQTLRQWNYSLIIMHDPQRDISPTSRLRINTLSGKGVDPSPKVIKVGMASGPHVYRPCV